MQKKQKKLPQLLKNCNEKDQKRNPSRRNGKNGEKNCRKEVGSQEICVKGGKSRRTCCGEKQARDDRDSF